MAVHDLKTWTCFFQDVLDDRKTFEVRENDRDFGCGDILVLREFLPKDETYTGRVIIAKVTYILDGGSFGIEKGFCVMGITVAYKDSGHLEGL